MGETCRIPQTACWRARLIIPALKQQLLLSRDRTGAWRARERCFSPIQRNFASPSIACAARYLTRLPIDHNHGASLGVAAQYNPIEIIALVGSLEHHQLPGAHRVKRKRHRIPAIRFRGRLGTAVRRAIGCIDDQAVACEFRRIDAKFGRTARPGADDRAETGVRAINFHHGVGVQLSGPDQSAGSRLTTPRM